MAEKNNAFSYLQNMSVEQLAAIFDYAQVGVIIVDKEGLTVWANKYYSRIVGFDMAQFFGKHIRLVSQAGNVKLPSAATMWDILQRTKKESSQVVKYETDDYVITTATPIMNEQGEIEWTLYIITNYSEVMSLQKELMSTQLKQDVLELQLKTALQNDLKKTNIIVKDKEMQRIYDMGRRLASVDATVMILGESGVGKDVLAKYIHSAGSRAQNNFVHVNLASVPASLFESELFGYEPGAFTGASRKGKIGLIEMANGGTLFLNEIGEVPLSMQSKLLQVIQNKEIYRIGGQQPIPVDVRIISATNQDLSKMVEDGLFRMDLFYRLNVIEVFVPPLRERPDDIPVLALNFLDKFNKEYGFDKVLDGDTIKLLMDYEWPGNVRELLHLIERLVIMSPEQNIRPESLPAEYRMNYEKSKFVDRWSSAAGGSGKLKNVMAEVEKEIIREAVLKHRTLGEAAAALGIDVSTLVKKRKKYGIEEKSE